MNFDFCLLHPTNNLFEDNSYKNGLKILKIDSIPSLHSFNMNCCLYQQIILTYFFISSFFTFSSLCDHHKNFFTFSLGKEQQPG